MMKQQLAHTLKTSSVLLRTRTALTGTTDKGCLSSLHRMPTRLRTEKLLVTYIFFSSHSQLFSSTFFNL